METKEVLLIIPPQNSDQQYPFEVMQENDLPPFTHQIQNYSSCWMQTSSCAWRSSRLCMTRAWPSCLTEAENYLVMREACPIGEIKKGKHATHDCILSTSRWSLCFSPHKLWDKLDFVKLPCKIRIQTGHSIVGFRCSRFCLFYFVPHRLSWLAGGIGFELTCRHVLLVVLYVSHNQLFILSIRNITFICWDFLPKWIPCPSGAQTPYSYSSFSY